MLERYYSVVASQRETANARSENGFKSGSGSATEAFGESETRTEVRNRLLQAYQACTDDSSGNRKRRRRSNSGTKFIFSFVIRTKFMNRSRIWVLVEAFLRSQYQNMLYLWRCKLN